VSLALDASCAGIELESQLFADFAPSQPTGPVSENAASYPLSQTFYIETAGFGSLQTYNQGF
jgi:hypothetical protein